MLPRPSTPTRGRLDGPTAHWSVTHWFENPFVRPPICPKKCLWSENHWVENVCHWSDDRKKVSLVQKPIGSTAHWSENGPFVQRPIDPRMARHVQPIFFVRSHNLFSRAVDMLVTGKTEMCVLKSTKQHQ